MEQNKEYATVAELNAACPADSRSGQAVGPTCGHSELFIGTDEARDLPIICSQFPHRSLSGISYRAPR
jgi:hypothetical protein